MSQPLIHKPQLTEARRRSKQDTKTLHYHIPENASHLGDGRFYYIQTYGCQANESDSEKMRGMLESVGYQETTDETKADLILLNTCAIRANAENKVFGELGRLKPLKGQNKDLIIAVGGCMPQEEVVVDKILKTYHQVDVVFGTHNFYKLLEFLQATQSGHRKVIEVESQEGDIVESLPTVHQSRYKAWVDIIYGCDEFCTYCIVPYTRGKERSRQSEAIINEVKELIKEGYQEITLLGQNVNSYGLDFQDRVYRFADLLADLSQLDIPRIRFTTSHPKDFSDALINVLATGKNLMPYIHLPVQSGSNKILKAMNRKYTKEDYLTLIKKIKTAIPDVSITTDIIVGFPGETDADFEETMDLVNQCDFEGAYTFIYSPRSGTPAATYPDNTPKSVKKARLLRLNERINEGYAKGNHRFLDQTVNVLVEGRSKTNPLTLTGYTEHNKLVNFIGDDSDIGKIVKVHVTDAKTWSLSGEIIRE